MIHFACVQCDRRHKVHESMSGATVKCPCGQIMLVPTPDAAPESPAPASDTSLFLTCVCGKKLRVPRTAIGKSVRCSCGETLAVAGSEESMMAEENAQSYTPAPNTIGGDNLGLFSPQPTGQLPGGAPSVNAWNGSPPTSYGSTSAAGQGSYGQPNYGAVPQNQNPYGASYTHDYLRNAHAENEAQHQSNQVEYSTELNTARWTLIVVGILMMFVNFALFIAADSEVASIAQEEASKGVAVDQGFLVVIVRIVYAFSMVVGVFFMLLGTLVYRFPVVAPSIGLALYVLINIMTLVLNPMSFVSPIGIIIRIAIIGTLVKAINSGIYYRR